MPWRATPTAATQQGSAESRRLNEKITRLGLSPRQQRLNALYAVYKNLQYEICKQDWDGTAKLGALEHEVIASAENIPPGFYDAGGAMAPLKFRRPCAMYPLVTVIVNRFTGQLFDEKRHPQVKVKGDEATDDFVAGLIGASSFWAHMNEARAFGGSQGTAVIGFMFDAGQPVIEVFDPRWCRPEWKNRRRLQLASVEIRYQYPIEVQDPTTGAWIEIAHWYRRIIDDDSDTLWKPQPVTEEEPNWNDGTLVDQQVEHKFGFCPVVWCQNLPASDDIDGDPDCPPAVYELSRQIDHLLSGGCAGTIKNCDPTTIINTAAKLADLTKGSDNAIKLPGPSDDAHYMEISGAGLQLAFAQASTLRGYVLEVSQCVLDHPEVGGRTATEIERVYSSMLSKVNVLRGQWGENAVKVLLQMMVDAARMLSAPRVDEEGKAVQPVLKLPPKMVKEGEKEREEERKLGKGGTIDVKWPPSVEPTAADAQAAVVAASGAKQAGLVDAEHASRFVSSYFGVEDVPAMLEKANKETEQQTSQVEQEMMGRLRAVP